MQQDGQQPPSPTLTGPCHPKAARARPPQGPGHPKGRRALLVIRTVWGPVSPLTAMGRRTKAARNQQDQRQAAPPAHRQCARRPHKHAGRKHPSQTSTATAMPQTGVHSSPAQQSKRKPTQTQLTTRTKPSQYLLRQGCTRQDSVPYRLQGSSSSHQSSTCDVQQQQQAAEDHSCRQQQQHKSATQAQISATASHTCDYQAA
jgi:hypothetical protein